MRFFNHLLLSWLDYLLNRQRSWLRNGDLLGLWYLIRLDIRLDLVWFFIHDGLFRFDLNHTLFLSIRLNSIFHFILILFLHWILTLFFVTWALIFHFLCLLFGFLFHHLLCLLLYFFLLFFWDFFLFCFFDFILLFFWFGLLRFGLPILFHST